jgi:hypothetical protein
MRMLREQKGQFLQEWLTEQCAHWNQGIQEILDIHLATPSPTPPRGFDPRSFDEAPPDPPVTRQPGFLAKFIRSRREAAAG